MVYYMYKISGREMLKQQAAGSFGSQKNTVVRREE